MNNKDQIQDKALQQLKLHQRASVNISMGVGKTLIALKHMQLLYNVDNSRQFLVVIPKLVMIKNWKEEIAKFGYSEILKNVNFVTYRSLSKSDLSKYFSIYLDECHNITVANTVMFDFFKGRIVGLTGTAPSNSNKEKQALFNKYCPVVFNYEIDEAVEEKILNDYEIIVHMIPLSDFKNLQVKTKNHSYYTSERKDYDSICKAINNSNNNNENLRILRMTKMLSYKSKERYAKSIVDKIEGKVLIFSNTKDQADRLCKHSVHSNNEDSETNLLKFKHGIISKLSAVFQLSEGVNIPNLKSCVILHAFASDNRTPQRIGRALRLNPNEKSTIHILCYKDTMDEYWVKQAISKFDQLKIKYINAY